MPATSNALRRRSSARGSQEHTPLPQDLDYASLAGLSNEVRQQLAAVRPATLGQAARVPGVTPAAVSILLVHLRRRGASVAATGAAGKRRSGAAAASVGGGGGQIEP